MRAIKEEIEQKLTAIELDDAWLLMEEYEKEAPMDMDLLSFKIIYFIYKNEIEKALRLALKGIRSYPVSGDMYYNLAYIYELKEDWLLAGENYMKAQIIYAYSKDEKAQSLQIAEKLAVLMQLIGEKAAACKKLGDFDYAAKVESFKERQKYCFGLDVTVFRKPEQIMGQYIWTDWDEKRYVGIQKPQYSKYILQDSLNLVHTKGELLNVDEGRSYQVSGQSEEYLLPVAVRDQNTRHFFKQGRKAYAVLQKENRHFNYYKVKNGTTVESQGISYYGSPIPLGHDRKRKKLVLNIFVDGLSQEILNGKDFEKIMPYTFRFFSSGTICTQAYSSAEWTYPSLANYVTGLDTLHHMMYHNEIEGKLPEDVPTLAEYFKEMGYITTKMDGDWRSVPSYGHARGYDRCIYQNQVLGSKQEAMIGDTIEQLEGLKDTDQFMWICMGDLHDVADGYDLPFSVQAHIELENRAAEDAGKTSVKQAGSKIKISNYKKMASYTDVLLNALYTYILDNYKEDEFLVSLFADHGQGYLVPNGGHFLSKERAKVAFMFRGGAPEQISDEIISTSDYVTIMNWLAGIPMKPIKTMGNLPACFGGKTEREYALCESLHPKDAYCATFFTKQYTIYFENGAPVGEDGRFELRDYKISITDMDGTEIQDESIRKKYLDIILEYIAPVIIY